MSALVPYKRIDVAIRAAAQAGVRLTIVGSGPDLQRLRALAGPEVTFAGALDGTALREAYRQARALVLPAEEDFGIAPVEAMACGRPVIALGRGGAVETVEPGVTGLLVDRATPAAFADAMREIDAIALDTSRLVRHASQFGVARFEREFAAVVTEALATAAAC